MRRLLLWLMLIAFLSGCEFYLPRARRSGLPPGHGGIPPGHGGIPPGQAKKMGPPPVRLVGIPSFVLVPGTNVRVVLDIDVDIFSVAGYYYYYHRGSWYVGRHYEGPWRAISARNLPSGLRGQSPYQLKAKAKGRRRARGKVRGRKK